LTRPVAFAIALTLLIFTAFAGSAFAAPMFAEETKQAVFLSPLESWRPTWNIEEFVSILNDAGYHVDVMLNDNASISFLRTELSNYDLIILRTDSFGHEGLDYFCSGDPIRSDSRTALADAIAAHEIQVGACIGFSTIFIQNSYPSDSLRPGLVFAIGSDTSQLSSAFLLAGFSAFVGYYEWVSLGFGRMDAVSIGYLRYLSKGYSVSDASIQLYLYVHTGHGNTANWVLPYWTGDGDFKI